MNRDPEKWRALQRRARDKAIAKARRKRRTPIRPMSAKRKAELGARALCRATVLARACYQCEVPDCREPAVDVHEVIPRGRGGDWLDPANCLALCRAHHDWCHAHPSEAKRLGLLASQPPKG